MLKGRLGLNTARIPHADRQGLLWLSRGNLYVEDGSLRFKTAGSKTLPCGDYGIAFQTLSVILLGPGGTISHDAMRLMARHGTGLVAVGDDGVRFYASMPFGPDDSKLARKQVVAWSDLCGARIGVARRMYAWRLGEVFPDADISVLRGIEGSRMKEMYRLQAQQHGIKWRGRRFDRSNPTAADYANQAINHIATAVQSAAKIAVAVTGTIPQLGFIHEDSGISFCLDIADLYRDEVVLPTAFAVAAAYEKGRHHSRSFESYARRAIGKRMREDKLVPKMIDRIKELFDADDRGDHS